MYKGQCYRGPFNQDSTASWEQTWNIMVHITVLAIQDYSNQEDHTASDDVMSTLGLENITASGNLQGIYSVKVLLPCWVCKGDIHFRCTRKQDILQMPSVWNRIFIVIVCQGLSSCIFYYQFCKLVGAIQIDLFHQFLCSEKVSQAKVWTTRELQDIEGFSAQNVR